MKGYHKKNIRKMQGKKPGNPVGISFFGHGSKGLIERRVKWVWSGTKEEITMEKLNEQIQQCRDSH